MLIDLRSDTVTKPSSDMRKAMSNAEVGDDVYGDDPTVNYLEEKSADLFGKEDAIFVSSGTQGNLISVLSQAGRGDEILLGDICHIFSSEAGGVSVLGGVVMYPLKTNLDGTIDEERITEAVKPDDYHKPNDSTKSLGTRLAVDEFCRENNLKLISKPFAHIIKNWIHFETKYSVYCCWFLKSR